MELTKCLLFLPIFLMAMTDTSASEVNMKSQSSKFLSKLMGMKKLNPKSKNQRKSGRLPKMGFFGGSSFSSMMDDDTVQFASPRQDFSDLFSSSSRASPRQDFSDLLSSSSKLQSVDNSPVYYVRLPPTPYMYTPGLGYISQPSQSLTPYHGSSLNQFMSLPINFLSNGQPNGAYDFSMPELMSSAFPGKGFLRQEPPVFGRKSFVEDSGFATSLKGRFDFNGRPDSVYVLPESSYFHGSMFK
ncbi:uncharacterized protein LOC129916745 [Episyrphus balteatus]|uniref:uncharacterized protein LOC129916745 n=1 Tax=Episyrphus balteatus TaxID=286459 RepID=UPI00248558EE|nr:uncharacterized protein LOC129916745 [Episyrphus balteatus]